MSIDITKLRLGNFIDVYDRETGEWTMERLDIDMFNLLYLNPKDKNYRLSIVTNDNLLKLGFIKVDFDRWVLGDLSIFITHDKHIVFSDNSSYYVYAKYSLEYLYQVQNIYLSKEYKELL